MPIFSEKNLYPGMNIHLNSITQHEPGGWQSFHALHVTHLFEAIDAGLPPGYFARSEKTMQISEIIPPIRPRPSTQTTPDVIVFLSRTASPGYAAATLEATPPTRSLSIVETLAPDDFLPGIGIYQAGEGGLLGKPVTRIELLSPANKPGGTHYSHYLSKRGETLASGLRLVEIDYLHESRPIIEGLPSYVDGEDDASPFVILVSDPRPTLDKGLTHIYDCAVDAKLPVITIPLSGADRMVLDMGAVYNRTFASSRFFQMVVDYEQEPPHLDRYTFADQERIRKCLAAILQQYHNAPK